MVRALFSSRHQTKSVLKTTCRASRPAWRRRSSSSAWSRLGLTLSNDTCNIMGRWTTWKGLENKFSILIMTEWWRSTAEESGRREFSLLCMNVEFRSLMAYVRIQGTWNQYSGFITARRWLTIRAIPATLSYRYVGWWLDRTLNTWTYLSGFCLARLTTI